MKARIPALVLALGMLCACSSQQQQEQPQEADDSEPSAAVIEASEKMMTFHEAPSQFAFSQIVTTHDETVQWMERNGPPDAAAHTERLLQTFTAFAWKKHGYTGSMLSPDQMNAIVESTTKMEPAEAGDLDLLWSAFFATGETQYLDRITDAARAADPMVAGAARWSLKSNYEHQQSVRAHFDAQPEKKRAFLE